MKLLTPNLGKTKSCSEQNKKFQCSFINVTQGPVFLWYIFVLPHAQPPSHYLWRVHTPQRMSPSKEALCIYVCVILLLLSINLKIMINWIGAHWRVNVWTREYITWSEITCFVPQLNIFITFVRKILNRHRHIISMTWANFRIRK